MLKKELHWGMIGTGNVTEKKSGPAFNKIEGSNLVAIVVFISLLTYLTETVWYVR